MSLWFGALTSVTLAMLILPLCCIAARNAFREVRREGGCGKVAGIRWRTDPPTGALRPSRV